MCDERWGEYRKKYGRVGNGDDVAFIAVHVRREGAHSDERQIFIQSREEIIVCRHKRRPFLGVVHLSRAVVGSIWLWRSCFLALTGRHGTQKNQVSSEFGIITRVHFLSWFCTTVQLVDR